MFGSLRPSHIERIERRIQRLDRRATDLLSGERQASEEVAALQSELDELGGAIRAMRMRRRLRRRVAAREHLRSQRRDLVDGQIREIMFALQAESRRARDELDRQLEQLVPVQERWEGLRGTFDALEETLDGPAFAGLTEQWRGQLEIPEFPVAQKGGYAKPFPQHALLF